MRTFLFSYASGLVFFEPSDDNFCELFFSGLLVPRLSLPQEIWWCIEAISTISFCQVVLRFVEFSPQTFFFFDNQIGGSYVFGYPLFKWTAL